MHRSEASTLGLLSSDPRDTSGPPGPKRWQHRTPKPVSPAGAHTPRLGAVSFIQKPLAPRSSSPAMPSGPTEQHTKPRGGQTRPSWTRGVPTPSTQRFRSPFRQGCHWAGGPSLILSCSHAAGCGISGTQSAQGGEEIAKEEEEEGEAAHEHLGSTGSGRDARRPSRVPPQARARLTCHSLHSGSRPG